LAGTMKQLHHAYPGVYRTFFILRSAHGHAKPLVISTRTQVVTVKALLARAKSAKAQIAPRKTK
jgi:hypothetical protein